MNHQQAAFANLAVLDSTFDVDMLAIMLALLSVLLVPGLVAAAPAAPSEQHDIKVSPPSALHQ